MRRNEGQHRRRKAARAALGRGGGLSRVWRRSAAVARREREVGQGAHERIGAGSGFPCGRRSRREAEADDGQMAAALVVADRQPEDRAPAWAKHLACRHGIPRPRLEARPVASRPKASVDLARRVSVFTSIDPLKPEMFTSIDPPRGSDFHDL
jgi:hypothetical protein